MDVHGAMVSQVQLFRDMKILSMAWSCEKFKMEEGEDDPGVTNAGKIVRFFTTINIIKFHSLPITSKIIIIIN